MPGRAGTPPTEAGRLVAAALGLVLLAAPGAPFDLTAAVRARPDLMAALQGTCERLCQGNRREASLRWVRALPLGGGRWRIEGEVALRNRHVQPVPAGLGGLVGETVTLFDHTLAVRGRGTLDRASCRLVLEAVELDRDPLGLSRLLAGEVGKSYRVERCGELLPAEPSRPATAPRRP